MILDEVVLGQVDRAKAFRPHLSAFVMHYSKIVDRDAKAPDDIEDERDFIKWVESVAYSHKAKPMFDIVAQVAFETVKQGVNELNPMFLCDSVDQLSTRTQRDTQHVDARFVELHLCLHKYVLPVYSDDIRIRAALHLCRELLTNHFMVDGKPVFDRFVQLVEERYNG